MTVHKKAKKTKHVTFHNKPKAKKVVKKPAKRRGK